jgi:hypothetical protein
MNTTLMTIDEAIATLKKAVKYSHIEGQKHIDLSLVNANELEIYQRALIATRLAVTKGELTEDDLKNRLGLV